MKDLRYLDEYRIKTPLSLNGTPETSGTFIVYVGGKSFYVIAEIHDNGYGKVEHVSVTPCNRKRTTCPTWEEMTAIKDMFFGDEEECYQVFPKKSEYVNLHPLCMHIWRQ